MKLKRMFMAALVACAAFGAWADTATVGGIRWAYSVTDGKATITNSSSNIGDISIPAYLGGNPVADWDVALFRYAVGLRKVTIPGGVKMPNNAFEGCTDLREVTIGAGVDEIANTAFNGCTALTRIRIPGSVKVIGTSAFAGCTSLAEIEIEAGGGTLEIGQAAFKDCTALEAFATPRLTQLDDNAFEGCSRMTELDLSNVGTIGNSTFINCPGK